MYSNLKRSAIIISIEYVYTEVVALFKNELPARWFDNNEVDDIIVRIFNIIISNIFNTISNRNSSRYEISYQSTIDYLEYCGVSQKTAFKIVHFTEMNILRTIFNTYGNLDDTTRIKILEHQFFDKYNIIIFVNFKNEVNNNDPTINYSNYQNTGLV